MTEDGKTAFVPLAGMLKVTDLEPVENITIGSSVAPTALDANDSVSVPDTDAGTGADIANTMGVCCVGAISVGNPMNVIEGKIARIATTNVKASSYSVVANCCR